MSSFETIKKQVYDAKAFGKVAVLLGGQYTEREISLQSGKCVLDALKARGVDAHPVDVDENISQVLAAGNFDRAFIALHGKGGEDGTIQGVLEYLKIPYTGSRVTASALSMDKCKTKLILQSLGIKTPKFMILNQATSPEAIIEKIGIPCVIKPIYEGSSFGTTIVESQENLLAALQLAFEYDKEIMAETYIMGNEYTVGILLEKCLPTIHITTQRKFYDYAAKYTDETTGFHIPCGLNAVQEEKLHAIALAVYQALGCRHWARVDVMQDQLGEFWVLELNTIAGLTTHSLVPKMAKAVSMDFSQLILTILAQTLEDKI
ncbi:MAG: D-alanine--D-alanine ligase [Pseudomonadota bacterium]